MKTYHEDRGLTLNGGTRSTKMILYPAMVAILLLGVAVENGSLQGDRESRMRSLLADGGRDRLIARAANHTLGQPVAHAQVRHSARLKVSEIARIDCHLLTLGDIQAEYTELRRGLPTGAWKPTAEFQADMDALCGAMISEVIERSGEA